MSEKTSSLLQLAKTFSTSPQGVAVAVVFLLGFFMYLDFKQDNNHIEHETQADIELKNVLEKSNEIDMQFIEVLTEIKTVINNK